MKKDPQSFRDRYNRWKLGESVYEAGRPIPAPARQPGDMYDYQRAAELGYERDETGHFSTRDYETGRYLKNPTHPTVLMSVVSDIGEGYNPYYNKKDGQLYSDTWMKMPKYAGGKDGTILNHDYENDVFTGARLFDGQDIVVTGRRKPKTKPYWVTVKNPNMRQLQPSEAMYPFGLVGKAIDNTVGPWFNEYVAPTLSLGNWIVGKGNPYEGEELRSEDERLLGAFLPLDFIGPKVLNGAKSRVAKYARGVEKRGLEVGLRSTGGVSNPLKNRDITRPGRKLPYIVGQGLYEYTPKRFLANAKYILTGRPMESMPRLYSTSFAPLIVFRNSDGVLKRLYNSYSTVTDTDVRRSWGFDKNKPFGGVLVFAQPLEGYGDFTDVLFGNDLPLDPRFGDIIADGKPFDFGYAKKFASERHPNKTIPVYLVSGSFKTRSGDITRPLTKPELAKIKDLQTLDSYRDNSMEVPIGNGYGIDLGHYDLLGGYTSRLGTAIRWQDIIEYSPEAYKNTYGIENKISNFLLNRLDKRTTPYIIQRPWHTQEGPFDIFTGDLLTE